MAAASVSDFRVEFPEFTGLSDAVIEAVLRRGARLHRATKPGTLYAAAHLHSLDQEKATDGAPDGGAGVVTSESIGSRSVGYAVGTEPGDRRVFWQRTPYGREFLKLEERNPKQAFGLRTF